MDTYFTVPPGVVVDIYDAAGASGQARLNQSIVLCKVGLVKGAGGNVVSQKLPRDGKTEDVILVVVHKVGHLTRPISTVVLGQRWVRRAGGV